MRFCNIYSFIIHSVSKLVYILYRKRFPVWYRLLILLVAGLTFISLPAQTVRLFQQYDARQGLSDSWISDIFQDSRGFIWVGTQYGLNRFDGYHFRFYTYTPNDTASISANWARSICEDQEGELWISTYGKGLNRFDPVTEKFTRFQPDPTDSTSLPGRRVLKIQRDRKGRMWVATDKGVCLYQKKQIAFRRFTKDYTYDIVEDEQGRIWAGSRAGLFLFDENEQTFRPTASLVGKVTKICPAKGKIWVFDDESLKTVAGSRGQWRVNSFPVFKDQHANEHFHSPIFQDRQGRMWVGTKDSLAILSASGAKIEYLALETLNPKNHQESYLLCLTEDRQGNIWVGTNNGISVYKPTLSRFRQSRYEQDLGGIPFVREILVFGDTVWYASREGLFRRINGEQENNTAIIEQAVYALCLDDRNWIYAATPQRLGFYQIHSRTLQQTFFEPEIIGDDFFRSNVFAIVKDLSGRIWLGNEDYLQCFDPVTKQFFQVHLTTKGDKAFVIELMIDKKGNLWAGTLSHGLFFTENIHRVKMPEEVVFTNYRYLPDVPNSLSSNVVQAIHQSIDEKIWVGTDGGLNLFQPESGSFRRFLREDGLEDDKIMNISSDRQGRLWLSTIGHGIICFDVANGTFFNFTTEDGLYSNDFMLSSGFRAEDGTIFFGAEGGLQIFHPDSIFLTDTAKVPLFFTDGQIAGHPLIPGDKDGVLTKSIAFTDRITLNHYQTNLSLQFAALHFLQPEKTEYAYQLKGLQPGWQNIYQKRDITFASLPPGDYELTIQAQNRELGWTAFSRPLQIEVLPPWWRSTSAYAIYCLLLTALLYGLYRFQLTRKLAMVEREQLKKLDAEKSRLYTNITHEFRTPLTLILGMADQIAREAGAVLREKAVSIRRNGKQLLGLVNQILDLSKLEAGGLKVENIQTDVIAFAKYNFDSFQPLAATKKIKLHFLSSLSVLEMDFDPPKLQSVLSNLLSNALKFTPPQGNVYVQISKTLTPTGEFLQMSIKDTGSGIAKAALPRIFDRFYQVADSTGFRDSQQGNGTGIGLALTKELVKLMNGTILVQSEVGEGTTFTVSLPVSREAHKVAPWKVVETLEPLPLAGLSVTSPLPAGSPGADAPVVLLIEDNPEVVQYLISCLENDYRLLIAYNGKEGVQQALEAIPDLIICDVMMPEMNGFAVCESLKMKTPTSHIPILLLTAKADQFSKIEGLESGADAYLSKPFDQEELQVRIRKLIELRKRLQQKYRGDLSSDQPAASLDEAFVLRIRTLVEDQLDNEDFGLPQLCKAIGFSRVHLYRKLKALTGQSPSLFIRQIRLEHGKRLLLSTDLTVSEVAFRVGFKDPSYFSRVFSEVFGKAPNEIRK